MSRREVIRSASNPLVARVRAALAGRDEGVLVLEGDRLVDDALAAKRDVEIVLVAASRGDRAGELERRGVDVREVEDELLQRVSGLATSQGVIGLAPVPASIDLGSAHLGPEALVLVVAGIAEPGNLGALARSAEAAGAQALGVVAGGTSPWNPRAVRGSMGSLLRLPVIRFASAESAADELREHAFRHVQAATRGGKRPASFDWSGRIALWVGSETGALPEVCNSFERITIPMKASVESLNVTVAASLLLFAAGRAES